MAQGPGPVTLDETLAPFHRMLRAAVAPMLLHDPQGGVLGVSPGLGALLDGTTEGRPSILDLLCFDSATGDGAAPQATVAVAAMPARLRTAAGGLMPVLFSATPIHDADGAVVARLCLLLDATEIRQTEAQLTDAVAKATEASRAKSRFLAAMSHEIRTPMNAILGLAQLLKLSNLDAKRMGHVNAIISAGGTLMNLLTDLLDLSQVEAGRMRIESRPFDLQAMLDQVADWWHSSAKEKGLRLNIALDRGLPQRVESDPIRLQQVLNNFLSNALKYTEAGRVVLSVEELARRDGTVRLRFSVSDTGIGMTAQQCANLFKPFVQIESDFGKDRGGWGLGLSICRNIAEMMRADIGVDSTPGEGTTFHFELDMAIVEGPAQTAEKRPDLRLVASSGLRILIAEDNTLNQDMMRTMLRDFGHEVVAVSNGFEAVEALIKDDFDMVLMDITMPGLDGLGATEQIRSADGKMRSVPIVACSAHVGDDVQDRYRRVGIDDFLPKPVDPEALQTVIRRVVSQG